MTVKVLLIPGYAMPKRVWADEALYLSQRFPWVKQVMISGGNPLGSYEQRAEQILAEVGNSVHADDVLITIAHSFGGIVARYMASMNYLRPRYLVTVASPHHGVRHADIYVRSDRDKLGPLLISWMFRRLYKSIASSIGTNDKALYQLSVSSMEQFNEKYSNVSGTSYWSYACVAERASLPLRIPHLLLSAYTAEPNDGIVTLESSKWGEFAGMVTCDHIEVVGAAGPNNFSSTKFLESIVAGIALSGSELSSPQ